MSKPILIYGPENYYSLVQIMESITGLVSMPTIYDLYEFGPEDSHLNWAKLYSMLRVNDTLSDAGVVYFVPKDQYECPFYEVVEKSGIVVVYDGPTLVKIVNVNPLKMNWCVGYGDKQVLNPKRVGLKNIIKCDDATKDTIVSARLKNLDMTPDLPTDHPYDVLKHIELKLGYPLQSIPELFMEEHKDLYDKAEYRFKEHVYQSKLPLAYVKFWSQVSEIPNATGIELNNLGDTLLYIGLSYEEIDFLIKHKKYTLDGFIFGGLYYYLPFLSTRIGGVKLFIQKAKELLELSDETVVTVLSIY